MAYWVLKIVLTPILRLVYRVRVEGRDNVPRTGPVILASNHQSFIDSIFLPLSVRRRVVWPNRLVGALFRVAPWLGDVAIGLMTRHFEHTKGGTAMPQGRPHDARSPR